MGKEEAETKALEVHRLATENKATTDRAKQLETDIGKVKAKLEAPQTVAVGHANPLGNVMAKLIGAAADVLTACFTGVRGPLEHAPFRVDR